MVKDNKAVSAYIITDAQIIDSNEIARVYTQSWKETYATVVSGLTKTAIDGACDHFLKPSTIATRRKNIKQSLQCPERYLYRVVKDSQGRIVGFLRASKNNRFNRLKSIYLLNEIKGRGIGHKLMLDFFAWIDQDKPSLLEVFSFNTHAINFYKKYGFVLSDLPAKLSKENLPYVVMIRACFGVSAVS